MDFTLRTYKHICSTLRKKFYTILTVNEYLRAKTIPAKTVVLRHDVDRRPSTALRMAKLEHEEGLRSTYYFRYVKGIFDPAIIHEISALGHEVGYHYETLSKCRGNMKKAIALFKEELEAFRQICQVHTVSMHGRPLLPWDNRELWRHATLRQFDLVGECYISINYEYIQYFSDTGRTWHPGKYNIRDHVQKNAQTPLLSTTDQLIQHINNNEKNNMCILTHPNRWSKGPLEWAVSAGTDWAVNQTKRILVFIRT